MVAEAVRRRNIQKRVLPVWIYRIAVLIRTHTLLRVQPLQIRLQSRIIYIFGIIYVHKVIEITHTICVCAYASMCVRTGKTEWFQISHRIRYLSSVRSLVQYSTGSCTILLPDTTSPYPLEFDLRAFCRFVNYSRVCIVHCLRMLENVVFNRAQCVRMHAFTLAIINKIHTRQ